MIVFRFGVAGPHRNEPWFVFMTIFTIGAFVFMLVSGLLFGSLVVEAEFGDDPALDVDDVATAVSDGGNFTSASLAWRLCLRAARLPDFHTIPP